MFITASFKDGTNRAEIERLCAIVRAAGFEDFCFLRDVEGYAKKFNDPKALMARAKAEIAKSDALLIDMTDKPTGRAIEAGIAFALGKRIVVVMAKGTRIKETTRGIADAVIEYDKIEDIGGELAKLAREWRPAKP